MQSFLLRDQDVNVSAIFHLKLPNTQTTHDHAHECFNEIITYLRITGR